MRKLDKRIQKVTDIKTPFSEDFEELSNYIGFNVYGADDVNHFHNLESCFFGALKYVYDDSNYPFVIVGGRSGDTMPFRYMILEKDLEPKEKKEKKYRPFTMEEFNDLVEFGEFVSYRQKDKAHTYCVMYVGNQYTSETEDNPQEDMVGLGPYYHSFEELLNDYEWLPADQDKWVPFGVEVEE